MQLKTWFDSAKQFVGFQINEGSKEWAHVTIELPEFLDLQKILAGYRIQFAEQVPDDLDPGARTEVIVNPRWRVLSDVDGLPPSSALLQVRHPGFGWCSFVFPKNEAAAMAEALTKCTHE